MNHVAMLVIDELTIEDPTWEDVQRAILSLDGRTNTEAMLAPAPPKGPPEGDHHMGIGGGKDGRCVVYFTEDNLRFWNLEDATTRHGEHRIRMLVGGQEGEFRMRQCVPREWALKAARYYFEHGKRADDLPWTLA
jgi:hypothetical protein